MACIFNGFRILFYDIDNYHLSVRKYYFNRIIHSRIKVDATHFYINVYIADIFPYKILTSYLPQMREVPKANDTR